MCVTQTKTKRRVNHQNWVYACNKFQIVINNNFNHFNHPSIFPTTAAARSRCRLLERVPAVSGRRRPGQVASLSQGGKQTLWLSHLQALLHVGNQRTSTFINQFFCESRRARRRERRRASLVRTCRTLCGSWADSPARGSGGPPGCCSRSRPGSSCGILWCTRRCLKHNVKAAGVQLLPGATAPKKSHSLCYSPNHFKQFSKSCLVKEFIWARLLLCKIQ